MIVPLKVLRGITIFQEEKIEDFNVTYFEPKRFGLSPIFLADIKTDTRNIDLIIYPKIEGDVDSYVFAYDPSLFSRSFTTKVKLQSVSDNKVVFEKEEIKVPDEWDSEGSERTYTVTLYVNDEGKVIKQTGQPTYVVP